MRLQFLEMYENTVLVMSHFTVPNVSPSPKSMNQAPMSANLPSVPVRLDTLTPTPPTTEKPVKTTVHGRQMNFFSKEPVREESQQTRVTVPAHTHTTAGQDRITPAEREQQTAKPCKPYLMRLPFENRGGERARVLRLPTSRENSGDQVPMPTLLSDFRQRVLVGASGSIRNGILLWVESRI